MDRGSVVDVFKERLAARIRERGVSKTAFAARVGLDRSSLSQILSSGNQRLPRAESLLAIAEAEQVSVDWLLGRTEDGLAHAEVLTQSVEVAGGPLISDERLAGWRRAAAGYKIRYVPTTLPDLVKTEATVAYESVGLPGGEASRAKAAAEMLDYERRPETDTEVCSPLHALRAFARGEGPWAGLPARDRDHQLARISELVDELYPTFRWFLYDDAEHFAAPMTIFGKQRVALYVGEMYLVLSGREQVEVLVARFDRLIRAARVHPHEVAAWIAEQRRAVPSAR